MAFQRRRPSQTYRRTLLVPQTGWQRSNQFGALPMTSGRRHFNMAVTRSAGCSGATLFSCSPDLHVILKSPARYFKCHTISCSVSFTDHFYFHSLSSVGWFPIIWCAVRVALRIKRRHTYNPNSISIMGPIFAVISTDFSCALWRPVCANQYRARQHQHADLKF